MAVSVEQLAKLVGASGTHPALVDCLAEGEALIGEYVTENALPNKTVPPPIRDRATLEVAADLWYRRNAPHGIVNEAYAGAEGMSSTPIRIGRDPMAAARPLLAQWVMPVSIS